MSGADLRFRVFESAQLQGSDLRKATLRTSWLRNANLSGAQMTGVQFGEWPYLEVESDVNSCAYSPDGKSCAMGLESGVIRVYDTSSWTTIHTLTGHTEAVNSVVYSPSGEQLVSGSNDTTVRLWDLQTGQCQMKIQDCGVITSLAWKVTSDDHYLGIGSLDKSVRQWKVKKAGEEYKAYFCWSTTHDFLTVRGASIEGVIGLSEMNEKLLKQREAKLLEKKDVMGKRTKMMSFAKKSIFS